MTRDNSAGRVAHSGVEEDWKSWNCLVSLYEQLSFGGKSRGKGKAFFSFHLEAPVQK